VNGEAETLNVPTAGNLECSRRIALFVASSLFVRLCCVRESDAELSRLWSEFVKLAAKLDADESSSGELERFEKLFDEICAAQATTIDGLCIKARVGCWTLMGDFDSASKSMPGARVAFSIMQDLIRTYHPELEKPNAVQRLIEEIEQSQ
jgi:hypothetical protein